MDAFQSLLKISGFGRQIYQGQSYSVKFRVVDEGRRSEHLNALKVRYPELLIHKTQKNSIIFGGTFARSSNFMYEVKLMMGQPVKG